MSYSGCRNVHGDLVPCALPSVAPVEVPAVAPVAATEEAVVEEAALRRYKLVTSCIIDNVRIIY